MPASHYTTEYGKIGHGREVGCDEDKRTASGQGIDDGGAESILLRENFFIPPLLSDFSFFGTIGAYSM